MVDDWHKVEIPFDEKATARANQLQNTFGTLFMATKAPEDAALLERTDGHGNVTFYFSPVSMIFARGLVEQNQGTTCAAPQKDGTRLLVGHAGFRDTLI